MKLPNKLKKLLENLPPCQKQQILVWYCDPDEAPPFMFCDNQFCGECVLFKSTIEVVCPYCKGTISSIVVVPKNELALCRTMDCKCRREFRIVFSKALCDFCPFKAKCLSKPLVQPKISLHEKIFDFPSYKGQN